MNPSKGHEHRLKWQREYRAANRGRQKAYRLKAKYTITPEQATALWAAQGGSCPICRVRLEDPATAAGDSHVDHDHETGAVRGILCPMCNKGLGHYADDPARLRRAAEYLEST